MTKTMQNNQFNQSATPGDSAPASAAATAAAAALRRRRALLSGLSKGAAAAAALTPLASQATRSYVLFNPSLGGNGYCSVSGFQSAAVSLAPGQTFTTCSSLKPADYFTTRVQAYTDLTTGPPGQRKRDAIKAMMLAQFGVIVSNADANTLSTAGNIVIIGGKVYLAETSTSTGGTIREIAASANFPTSVPSVTPTTAFNTLMGSGAVNQPVLYTLFLNADNAYFAAVYLSAIREDGAIVSPSGFTSGLIPFDAQYVATQYGSNPVAAAAFFRKISGA